MDVLQKTRGISEVELIDVRIQVFIQKLQLFIKLYPRFLMHMV